MTPRHEKGQENHEDCGQTLLFERIKVRLQQQETAGPSPVRSKTARKRNIDRHGAPPGSDQGARAPRSFQLQHPASNSRDKQKPKEEASIASAIRRKCSGEGASGTRGTLTVYTVETLHARVQSAPKPHSLLGRIMELLPEILQPCHSRLQGLRLRFPNLRLAGKFETSLSHSSLFDIKALMHNVLRCSTASQHREFALAGSQLPLHIRTETLLLRQVPLERLSAWLVPSEGKRLDVFSLQLADLRKLC